MTLGGLERPTNICFGPKVFLGGFHYDPNHKPHTASVRLSKDRRRVNAEKSRHAVFALGGGCVKGWAAEAVKGARMSTTTNIDRNSRISFYPPNSMHPVLCVDDTNVITPPATLSTTIPFLSLLGEFVRSSNDAIISKSLTGEIQTSNEGAERIYYGYSASEVIGQSIAILDPDDEATFSHHTILDEVRRGGEVKHFQSYAHQRMAVGLRSTLPYSPNSKRHRRSHWRLVCRATSSDRENTEELLRASEEQYRLLFQSNPIPMSVLDRNSPSFSRRK